MSKPAHKRVLSDSQAKAIGRNIRTSPRKLNLVAQTIRGKKAEAALATLTFSPRRIAIEVKKVLQSAIANAENNHDLEVDDLVVTEASVGKNMTLHRFHARGRGRSAGIEKPFAQITIVLEEKRVSKTEEKSAKKPQRKEAREAAAKDKPVTLRKSKAAAATAKKPQANKKEQA